MHDAPARGHARGYDMSPSPHPHHRTCPPRKRTPTWSGRGRRSTRHPPRAPVAGPRWSPPDLLDFRGGDPRCAPGNIVFLWGWESWARRGCTSLTGAAGRRDGNSGALAVVESTTTAVGEDAAGVNSAPAVGSPRASLATSDMAEDSGAPTTLARPNISNPAAVASGMGSSLAVSAASAVVAATGAAD
jgi:hypothetical protein